MFNLGMGEITVILLLALLVIGPKGLPEMAATLGKLIRDFRKTAADVKKEIQIDEHIRKPFEELRDAITLSPEELQRRDRIKKEIENLQKKVFESEKETLAAAEAQAAALHEGELPPSQNEAESGHESESARIAAAHAPTLPAPAPGGISAEPTATVPAPGHPGAKTLPFGSATASTESAPLAPPGLVVPVRAPEGTIARGASGRTIPLPAPSLPAPSLPAPSHGASLSPSTATATPSATPAHLPGPPPPSSPIRRTSPRIAPLPGPPGGPTSGTNVTQVLVEADIMSGAGGPPPPPRATLANHPLPPPLPSPAPAPVPSDDDDEPKV